MSVPRRTLLKLRSVVTVDPSQRILDGGAIVVDGASIGTVLTAAELGRLQTFDGEIVRAR